MTDSGPRSERLADHTTLRVGGPADGFVTATSDDDLVEVVSECDRRGESVLVLGGGSNLLVSDDGFPGTVVRVATSGYEVSDARERVVVDVRAGESWDAFVATSVERGWEGLEALSGIPGLVGATPIQNVGAYGSDVASRIFAVRTFDRLRGVPVALLAGECGFGYRSSVFKREPGRYLVLGVTFVLPVRTLGAEVRYPELARALGVELGKRAPAPLVREAVLNIRATKGMVLDAADHDTWSAGSFFTNPLLTPEEAATLPEEAPRWATGDLVKTSAAWLIQAAGFAKGFGNDRASLSGKHVLALTNRGGANAADLVGLAREVRQGVWERFGVELVPEVNLVGTSLGPLSG